MAGKKIGSSELIEFVIALLVGVLAVLGGLFVIAFLLVEPVRNPPGSSESAAQSGCPISTKKTMLPMGCTLNGEREMETAVCDFSSCNGCNAAGGSVCCCKAISTSLVDGIECMENIVQPSITNVTRCGCTVCDDITVTISMTVLNQETREVVRAAQVYSEDGENAIRPLGITDNGGKFIFTEPVTTRSITLLILAADFMQYRSLPILLEISQRTVILEIRLAPVMNIPIGPGGSAITLRLGPTAVISAPAGAFRTRQGATYNNMITFRGMFMTAAEDSEGFGSVPSTEFVAYDPESNTMQTFGALFASFLQFTGAEGEQLDSNDLRLAFQYLGAVENVNELFVAVWDGEQWVKRSNFTVLPEFRKKRQTPLPVVVEGAEIPVGVFMVIAQANGANCWLQGRVFDDAGSPISGPFISLESRVDVGGGSLGLFRFGTNTGSAVTSSQFVSNALCLPIHCNGIDSATLNARDGLDTSTMRLLPIEFPADTFDLTDPTPVVLGPNFLLNEVVVDPIPKPFYSDFDTCQANAMEDDAEADPSEYFRFQDLPVEEPEIGDTCFVKIQILDCFEGNLVTVTSIDPETGGINRTEDFNITELMPEVTTQMLTTMMTTEMTTDPMTTELTTDAMTTEGMTTDAMTTEGMTTEDMITDDETTTGSGTGPTDIETDPSTTMTTDAPTTMTTDPPTTMTTDPPTTMTTDPPTTMTTDPPTTMMTDPPTQFVCDANTATRRTVCLPYACGNVIQLIVRPAVSQNIPGLCFATNQAVLVPFISDDPVDDAPFVIRTSSLLVDDYNQATLGLYHEPGNSDMASMFARERCNFGGPSGSASDSDITEDGIAVYFSCLQ